MMPIKSRYYDAKWGSDLIEFKKGKSVWLDLVRYSEIILEINDDAKNKTATAFFIPSSDRTQISEILLVETTSIIDILSLDKDTAEIILTLNKKVPRSLNAQASLTLNDLRNISINKEVVEVLKNIKNKEG